MKSKLILFTPSDLQPSLMRDMLEAEAAPKWKPFPIITACTCLWCNTADGPVCIVSADMACPVHGAKEQTT